MALIATVTTIEGPLLYKSEAELKETESNKRRALENLQKALLKTFKTGLHTPLDNDFLLLFLRARKFKSSKALGLIINYYTVRHDFPDIFSEFTPNSVSHIFERGIVTVLPRVLALRPLTILVSVARWDVHVCSVDEIFKAMLITIEHTVRRDVTNQVAGYNFIFDMQGLNMSHVTQFTPFFARRAMNMLENAFPARVKALHHINVPAIVEGVFQVFKPFLSDKMKKRFAVTSSAEFIYNTYPDEEIPDYLGGQLNTCDAQQKWVAEVLSSAVHQEFLARSLWGYSNAPKHNESKKRGKYDNCDEW